MGVAACEFSIGRWVVSGWLLGFKKRGAVPNVGRRSRVCAAVRLVWDWSYGVPYRVRGCIAFGVQFVSCLVVRIVPFLSPVGAVGGSECLLAVPFAGVGVGDDDVVVFLVSPYACSAYIRAEEGVLVGLPGSGCGLRGVG